MNQGETSGSLSVQPIKRRRGRPRKDRSLNHANVTHPPLALEGPKGHPSQSSSKTVGGDYMVGQIVTGVIEATFDAGFLLKVRIGDSNTNLRGVVFKTGHYTPVTTENDVAPHLPMIRRNNVHLPTEKQGSSRGQKPMQTASLVPSKRKYAPPVLAPSVPPVGARGTVVPVVLQPLNNQNELPNSNQIPPPDASQTANMLAFEDKDVHVVEPISMLPPDRSIPAGQIFVPTQSHSGYQVAQGSGQNDNGSNEGVSEVVGQEDKPKPMTSTEIDSSGSSQMSDLNIENGKETMKSPAEDSDIVTGNANEPLSSNSLQTASAAQPMFNYGKGRMTELLQAVQENMKDNLVQFAEQPISAPKIEFHETNKTATNPEIDTNYSSPAQ